MDNKAVSNEEIHNFRKEIDANIQQGRYLAQQVNRGAGGRELSLVITKLQEAKMWAGKVLEAFGSELPEQYQDKA